MPTADLIAQQIRFHNRYAKQFRPAIKNALKNQYDHYVVLLHVHGPAYILNHTGKTDGAQLRSAILRMYAIVALSKATLTYRGLQRLPKIEKKRSALMRNGPGI